RWTDATVPALNPASWRGWRRPWPAWSTSGSFRPSRRSRSARQASTTSTRGGVPALAGTEQPPSPKPRGRLLVVGTPIGNLADLSPWAAAALRDADLIV